jgi:RHS repeat-associated protein
MTPLTASLRPTPESTPPTWRSGTYKYDASGNIYAIGVDGDTGSPLQHRYAYDELSRLKRADTMTSPTTHTETFTYDVYGNLTEHVDGSSTTSTPVEASNTNRLAWSAAHPYTYDAAGNLTADFNASYAYDPIGMLREKDYMNEPAEYYIYTASDERIGVKYGTSSGSPTIWSIRDFSGNVLRQYEGHDQSPQMAWLWVEDYIYRDGQLLAAERVPEEGGRRHFHLDHLGSPRLVTGRDSKEMSEHDYEPFGLESNYQETAGGFDREDPKRFTGHERDYAPPGESPASTAYLDYMHARYYDPRVARFLSLDTVIDAKAALVQPQSWNRYQYVRNNPLRFLDPTGHYTCSGYSSSECAAFDAALMILRAAAFEAARAGARGATRLRDVMNFYGGLGQPNGVAVNFGTVKGGAPMATELNRATNTVTVTVDRTTFASNASNYFQTAVQATHEGDHGLNITANPSLSDTHNFQERLGLERSAYRTQSYINSSLRVEDGYETWSHENEFNSGKIGWWALQSTILSCQYTPGGCTP